MQAKERDVVKKNTAEFLHMNSATRGATARLRNNSLALRPDCSDRVNSTQPPCHNEQSDVTDTYYVNRDTNLGKETKLTSIPHLNDFQAGFEVRSEYPFPRD